MIFPFLLGLLTGLFTNMTNSQNYKTSCLIQGFTEVEFSVYKKVVGEVNTFLFRTNYFLEVLQPPFSVSLVPIKVGYLIQSGV